MDLDVGLLEASVDLAVEFGDRTETVVAIREVAVENKAQRAVSELLEGGEGCGIMPPVADASQSRRKSDVRA